MRARLRELFGDDPQGLAEIEREFWATVRDVRREIAETSDCAVIARAAHRLKGAAGMIGASALHDIAAALERAALAEDLAAVRRLAHELLSPQSGERNKTMISP